MNLLTKQRLHFIALVIFTLWPIAHHVLVLKYDINPWKLAGWSMYCVRPAPIQVDVLTKQDAMPDGWLDALPGELIRARDQFAYDRRMWGILEEPGEVAAAAFTAAPELDHVRIQVRDNRLDRRTATIVAKVHVYDYDRAVAPPPQFATGADDRP